MPACKDKKTGKWNASFYYRDREGVNKHKFKRGFSTKKDALKFEEQFKREKEGSPSMRFTDFCNLYIEDQSASIWKPTTRATKVSKISKWILPFFGEKALDAIQPIDIKKWQNWLIESGLSPATQKNCRKILTAIFNYAIKYYNLKENPCHKVEPIGTYKREKLSFWTLEEFNAFLELVTDPSYSIAFKTLFYTGLRIGELTALTPADFDFSVPKLTVNRNYQVVEGKEYFIKPKTEKSKRDVILPEKLAQEIQDYINNFYGLGDNDRVFHHNKSQYGNVLRAICDENNIERIRIHDLRHSHASLLIELGYSPILIAERLGHDSVQTTLDTYSHLYPSKQNELAQELNNLML